MIHCWPQSKPVKCQDLSILIKTAGQHSCRKKAGMHKSSMSVSVTAMCWFTTSRIWSAMRLDFHIDLCVFFFHIHRQQQQLLGHACDKISLWLNAIWPRCLHNWPISHMSPCRPVHRSNIIRHYVFDVLTNTSLLVMYMLRGGSEWLFLSINQHLEADKPLYWWCFSLNWLQTMP